LGKRQKQRASADFGKRIPVKPPSQPGLPACAWKSLALESYINTLHNKNQRGDLLKTAVFSILASKARVPLKDRSWFNQLPLVVREPLGALRARKQGDRDYKAKDYLKRALFFNVKGNARLAERYYWECIYTCVGRDIKPNATEAQAYLGLHKICIARRDYFNAHEHLTMAVYNDNSIDRSWFTLQNIMEAAENGLMLYRKFSNRNNGVSPTSPPSLEMLKLAEQVWGLTYDAYEAMSGKSYPPEIVKDALRRVNSIRKELKDVKKK
jgi:hypothetical protein